ncbi:glycosyltransferase family 4 protein [Deinococcus malanensis]|uniref:glycosyltransferase family 4 protein n=1 Tax=Deinococcus malanensis TaxID=1706855 RepID=UPI0036312AE1
MRVAYVCADPGVPTFGMKGSSIHVQEVLRALLRTGTEVTLFAPRTGGSAPQDLSSVQVHALPRASKDDPADREQAQLAANDATLAALQEQGPFDLVYERYSLWSHAGMTYARGEGIPGVLEVNAPLVEEQAQHRGLIDRTAAEDVARRAFGASSLLVAVSREVGAYLQAMPEATGRVQVIPNGVNPGRFPEDLLPDLPAPGIFTVGFVGTLKPWHGLPTLLEAFEELRREVPAAGC